MKKMRKNVIEVIAKLIDKSGKNAEQLQKLFPFFSALLRADVSNFIKRNANYSESSLDQVREICGLEPLIERKVFFVEYKGGRTTNQLLVAGKYEKDEDGHRENDLDRKDFPMRSRAVGRRIIVFLKTKEKIYTYKQILAMAKKQGLTAPLYEDALLFGEKYPNEQYDHVEGSIIFMHEPVRPKFKTPGLIWLFGRGWHRYIGLFSVDWGFDARNYRFAFIREPKQKIKQKKEKKP